MAALAGVYTQLTHDREIDYRMIDDGDVDTVLILQPDWNKVVKIWKKIKHKSGARIILRMWDWDDGRTEQNPEGVYGFLRDHPIQSGLDIVNKWKEWWENATKEAKKARADFPTLNQVLFHTINEPDTNHLEKQINLYTKSACDAATAYRMRLLCLNFGTGHPAKLVAGPGSDPSWVPYIEAIQSADKGRHVIGLHEYYNNKPITDSSLNPWHIMRHTMYTAREALRGSEVIISEWGVEMLVNDAMNRHHGFATVVPNKQFADDLVWYCKNVAPYVGRVLIFASDLPDRVWFSFDPTLAYEEIVSAMRRLHGEQESGQEPEEPEPSQELLILPCEGILSQRFGQRPEYYSQFGAPGHNGIDIAAAEGTPILAVADGVVDWIAEDPNYGKYIRVWHEHLGMHTFYAHLSDFVVEGGQRVQQGQVIAKMGNTGKSTGPHLHFEIRFGKRFFYHVVHKGYTKGQGNPESVYATFGKWL